MTDWSYGSTGGPGGIHAHTADMEHAAGVIRRACQQLRVTNTAITSQLGYANRAFKYSRGQWTHTPAWRARDSLLTVQDPVIGLPALEAELEDLELRVRQAAEQYLEAERANQLRISALQKSWRSVHDGVGSDIWVRRHFAGMVWDRVTKRGESWPLRNAVGDWIRPSGAPPTTGYLNRDTVQNFLSFIDHPMAMGPFQYESLAMYVSGILLMVRQWSGAMVMTQVEPLPTVEPLDPPSGIADLFRGVFHAHQGHRGVVGIHEVPQPDGTSAYVVYIPGTEDWHPGTTTPFNPVSNSKGVIAEVNEAMAVTVSAMEAAGIPPDAPVMLAGYSQGGLTATALAASSGFTRRFNVTHVATAGSPTGRIPRAKGIQYFHSEIAEDITPGVDGAPKPDRANVTTVSARLRDSPEPLVAARGRDLEGAHHPLSYLAVSELVDANPTVSTQAWSDSARAFLNADTAYYTEYQAVPTSS